MDQTCFLCSQIIREKVAIFLNGNFIHGQCFKCSLCCQLIEKTDSYSLINNQLTCSKHLKKTPVEYFPDVEFVEQPLKIQIGNYNIRPTPVIVLKPPTPFNMAVRVDLVEASTGKVLKDGLQAGQVRSLKAGISMITFSGLKLNKLKPIKAELQISHSHSVDTQLCLEVTVGAKKFQSSPFTMISSCSQLSEDIKSSVTVRTSKKRGLDITDNPTNHISAANNSIIQSLRMDLEEAIQRGNRLLSAEIAKKLAIAQRESGLATNHAVSMNAGKKITQFREILQEMMKYIDRKTEMEDIDLYLRKGMDLIGPVSFIELSKEVEQVMSNFEVAGEDITSEVGSDEKQVGLIVYSSGVWNKPFGKQSPTKEMAWTRIGTLWKIKGGKVSSVEISLLSTNTPTWRSAVEESFFSLSKKSPLFH